MRAPTTRLAQPDAATPAGPATPTGPAKKSPVPKAPGGGDDPFAPEPNASAPNAAKPDAAAPAAAAPPKKQDSPKPAAGDDPFRAIEFVSAFCALPVCGLALLGFRPLLEKLLLQRLPIGLAQLAAIFVGGR